MLILVSMTLTLMHGRGGSTKAKHRRWIFATTKQAISVKLATMVDHFEMTLTLNTCIRLDQLVSFGQQRWKDNRPWPRLGVCAGMLRGADQQLNTSKQTNIDYRPWPSSCTNTVPNPVPAVLVSSKDLERMNWASHPGGKSGPHSWRL